jgi:phage terminase small subunit
MQTRFVRRYVSGGATNAAQCAREAGYSEQSALHASSLLLRNPAVREAVQAETLAAIGDAAPGALASMVKLALGAKSEMVRQVASKDILDRAGFKPPDRHMVAMGGSIDVDIRMGD